MPNPGTGAKDPLSFVLELKGTVKVVTNDRTVATFATNFIPVSLKETFQEVGAAGTCLEPEHGYAYVSFGYLDNTAIFRNGMVRYSTTPGTFGLEGREPKFLLDLFARERSATSHQIGPCVIRGNELVVPVGYGNERAQSQNQHSTLGSILRMDLDFAPYPGNPFADGDDKTTAIDYLYSYGHRNVFGLELVGERLFATENGGSIDRFLEIEGGENYLWRGDDWSIAARAGFVFGPSVGLVQLDYLAAGSALFPERYRGRFFIALAGTPGASGPGGRGERSVVMLRYDSEAGRAAEPPNQLVAYRGDGFQLPVSVAFGPDGLYFIALLPQVDGSTPVMKITFDPDRGHRHVLGADVKPAALLNQYGCRQCHVIAGAGGRAAPALGGGRIRAIAARLAAPDYAAKVAEIDRIDGEPFASYRARRGAILAAAPDQRLGMWLQSYLREPAFDNPRVRMPSQGVSAQHAEILTDFFVALASDEAADGAEQFTAVDRLRFWLARQIPELRYRHLIAALGIGGVIGVGVAVLVVFALARRRRPV